MPLTPFVTLVFKGRRFNNAQLPLETVTELAAYRALVEAAAAYLYKQDNPSRHRVPKGFYESFQLVLTGTIEEGSAVPSILRKFDHPFTPALFASEAPSDLFDQGRALIEKLIAEAAAGRLDKIPPQLFAGFKAFGSSLEAEEAIVVAGPGTREGPAYDAIIRQRILATTGPYEDSVMIVGEVRMADLDEESFKVRTTEGEKIEVRSASIFLPVALRSLSAEDRVQVRVRGIGVFSAQGHLQRISMATDVRLAEEGEENESRTGCPTPMNEQIATLRGLAPGWLDGEGLAYRGSDLDWLEAYLARLVTSSGVPCPYIYPTPEGAVRVEWSAPKAEIVLTFDLSNYSIDGFAEPVDRDGEGDELALMVGEPDADARLKDFLRSYLAGGNQ